MLWYATNRKKKFSQYVQNTHTSFLCFLLLPTTYLYSLIPAPKTLPVTWELLLKTQPALGSREPEGGPCPLQPQWDCPSHRQMGVDPSWEAQCCFSKSHPQVSDPSTPMGGLMGMKQAYELFTDTSVEKTASDSVSCMGPTKKWGSSYTVSGALGWLGIPLVTRSGLTVKWGHPFITWLLQQGGRKGRRSYSLCGYAGRVPACEYML